MKKVISLMMVVTLIFALAACAANTENNKTDDASITVSETAKETSASIEESTDESSNSNKSLVVYFSRTGEQYGVGVIEKGNTAIVADMIAEQTGADSFEITPKDDNYPASYNELTEYAKEELNNNARPEIASTVDNFDSYETIYLGYPIWWGDLPMICYTFLESYDFSGKTVIPFCTHAGSGNAGTQSKIQSAVPKAEVKEVFAMAGTETQNNPDSVKVQVEEWLNK